MHDSGYGRWGHAERQLLQGEGAQDHSDLLNARPQKLPKLFLILRGYLNLDGASRHAQVQPESSHNGRCL